MKRGEIYFADLDPTVGAENQKKRPVLIISNNANNKMAATLTVVPITSVIKKLYPFEVLLESNKTGLSRDSKAQCHQIRTISKLRITSSAPIGMVDKEIIKKLEGAIKLHLDMV